MECKLCPKKFSNAKALGAHMKIHYAPLPVPPKTPKKEDIIESTICSLDADPDDDHKPLVALRSYGLRQNPKKKKRVDDLVKDPAKKESLADDGFEIEDVAFWLMMLSRDVRKVHKCATCGRVFKSSQGLGSHRAVRRDDHKRMRKSCDVVLKNEMMKPKIWDLNLMGFEDGDEDNDDDGDGLLDLNLPASAEDEADGQGLI